MPHPRCHSLQESPAFTGPRGDQLAANVKQSVTCFLRRALPPGRQLRRLPSFLFGLGHPGGQFYLSAKIIFPVRFPASPARRDRRLIHASGGGELLSFISASNSLGLGAAQRHSPHSTGTSLRAPASPRQGDPSGASLWAPALRPGPVSARWGLAPRGPPGHRRASQIPRGPGAGQRHLRLLSDSTPGPRRLLFRETLSGSPSSLRPSACARRRLAASREAPAPVEGEGRRPPPQSPVGSAPPHTPGPERGLGCLQYRPPVHHLHSGTELPGDGTLFLRIYIGPSGARGLSVRHLQIIGHAPYVLYTLEIMVEDKI
ncbi:hypothetical protein NDU88_000333 [Pleurodeles waltl]|uniref:Uncharacterized protein n=1 Tax=Pleurodeles waltl TaxID=8319 RepID=A0AAV7SX01_PLEWA|nr:hypothetical protein NDU88_000333 [Pleurodeles waltl]